MTKIKKCCTGTTNFPFFRGIVLFIYEIDDNIYISDDFLNDPSTLPSIAPSVFHTIFTNLIYPLLQKKSFSWL